MCGGSVAILNPFQGVKDAVNVLSPGGSVLGKAADNVRGMPGGKQVVSSITAIDSKAKFEANRLAQLAADKVGMGGGYGGAFRKAQMDQYDPSLVSEQDRFIAGGKSAGVALAILYGGPAASAALGGGIAGAAGAGAVVGGANAAAQGQGTENTLRGAATGAVTGAVAAGIAGPSTNPAEAAGKGAISGGVNAALTGGSVAQGAAGGAVAGGVSNAVAGGGTAIGLPVGAANFIGGLAGSEAAKSLAPGTTAASTGVTGGTTGTGASGTTGGTTVATGGTSLEAMLQEMLGQSQADTAKQRAIDARTNDLKYGIAGTPLTGADEGAAQAAFRDFQTQQRSNDVQTQLQDIQLAALKQGGRATPEQIALIDQQTGAAQASGESDIKRFLLETQRQINDETAQAAGLLPTDTPTLRLSERAGEEAARQQGQLTLGLRSANANARLNYPLAAQQIQTVTANSTGQLDQAAAQFRAQLAQQAADNRLRLGQQPISNTLGLIHATRPVAGTRGQTGVQSYMDYLKAAGMTAGGLGDIWSTGSRVYDWLKSSPSNNTPSYTPPETAPAPYHDPVYDPPPDFVP